MNTDRKTMFPRRKKTEPQGPDLFLPVLFWTCENLKDWWDYFARTYQLRIIIKFVSTYFGCIFFFFSEHQNFNLRNYLKVWTVHMNCDGAIYLMNTKMNGNTKVFCLPLGEEVEDCISRIYFSEFSVFKAA